MQELLTCPVCTLYLRPGMALEDHLETHPKEQVIKALVSLAVNPTRTSQDFSTVAPCGNFNNSQQPPATQYIFTPPPPPRPNVMIVNRQSTMVVQQSSSGVNREQSSPTQRIVPQPNFIAPPQLQIFALTPPNPTNTTPQRLPPPPAYGTAINHLRSQQNQNQFGFHTQLSSSSSSSSPSLLHRNSPHLRSPLNQTTPVSTGILLASPQASPRPQSSPSVLRYAESPISAQYVERENGDFIVQESPRHVVECVETENGQFSVIEKVIKSPPRVVQFSSVECDTGYDNDIKEYVANDQYYEAQEEELPATPSSNMDEEIAEEQYFDDIQATSFKGTGVKDVTVLSNVKLDPNESLEIMENLGSMQSKGQRELIWSGLADIQKDDESRIEITGKSESDAIDSESPQFLSQASTSTATSVIRLASNKKTTNSTSFEELQVQEKSPCKNVKSTPSTQQPKRPFKKQPKKLTVKFKVAVPGLETGPSEKDAASSEMEASSGVVHEQETQVQSSNLVVELETSKCSESKDISEGPPSAQTVTKSTPISEEGELNSTLQVDTSDNAIDIDNSLIMIPKQETDTATVEINLEAAQPMIVHEPSLGGDLHANYPDVFSMNTGFQQHIPNRAASSEPRETSIQLEEINEISRQRIEFSQLFDEMCKEQFTILTTSNSSTKSFQPDENNPIVEQNSNIHSANFLMSTIPKDMESSSINCELVTSSLPEKSSASTSFDLEPAETIKSSDESEEKQQKQVEQAAEFNSDYPFGLLYDSTNSTEGQSWSRYVTPQQMSQFHEMEEQSNYIDLDTYKITSFQVSGIPNIHTDEKMPAKGEISEQESNGDVENSWSNPHYTLNGFRMTNSYEEYRSNWMENTDGVMPFSQDIVTEIKTDPTELPANSILAGIKNEEPSSAPRPPAVTSSIPSRKNDKALSYSRRLKQFQCTHCSQSFPLLKQRNAHLIEVHGYKRVNRRLIREAPSCTITTENLAASVVASQLPTQLDNNVTITPSTVTDGAVDDVKPDIKPEITVTSTPIEATVFPRTKYDSMRAEVYRMLMHFNLNTLKAKNIAVDESFFESKSFCCFTCKRSFINVKLYDEHLAEHPAECFTCGRKFTRWTYLSLHLKRHIGWKDFACTVCEKKFVIRSALVEHTRTHTGISPLKCPICAKTFKRYSNLTHHKKVCHSSKLSKKKDYVCYCGEVLPSKARFLWHKETHETKPKVCPYCRDRFVHRRSLKRHIRLTHSDKFDYVQPVKCKECKQVYAKASMKTHMLTHSIVSQYECSICNKSFSTKWNLKIHSWVHANRTSKPYKCEHCIKAFVREVDYKNHINSHKNIKPYTCEFCGCKFIRKYNYMRHRKEHTAQKRFKCDLCGKTFHRNYYLIEHRRMHTGERPFLCTICGKSSTTKTNHNKHLKIHHSRDPFTAES